MRKLRSGDLKAAGMGLEPGSLALSLTLSHTTLQALRYTTELTAPAGGCAPVLLSWRWLPLGTTVVLLEGCSVQPHSSPLVPSGWSPRAGSSIFLSYPGCPTRLETTARGGSIEPRNSREQFTLSSSRSWKSR
uniref:Uncharacterized protein n=1 Tax=Molossus molossus TaxID=27622 RepID=A0A7J8CS75_MOLMO|nr:hypothetical protein HJG59_009815 [Molossus molossus]